MVIFPDHDPQLLSTFGITFEERALATARFCLIPASQCLFYPRSRYTSAFDLELSVGIKPYHIAISNMPK